MANQQLLDYIKQQAQQGKNREEMKQELLAVGWEKGDIKEAFNTTNFAQSSDLPLPPSFTQEQTPTLSALPGVGDLLKRAFLVYKARLGIFLGIMIFPVILGLFLLIVSAVLRDNLPFGIFFLIIFWLSAVIINFWSEVSLIFAIRYREEKIGIIESFRRGRRKIISFVWILILAGFFIVGGYGLFIIPGIIFSIWFVFSFYVLASEDLRGMNALFRSKQLVAGYWWEVFWRFFVMGAIVFLPIFSLYTIMILAGASDALIGFVDEVISRIFVLFVIPFFLVFCFLLYEDLKRQKAQIPFEPPKKGTKINFTLIGAIGLLIGLLLILTLVFSSIFLLSLF